MSEANVLFMVGALVPTLLLSKLLLWLLKSWNGGVLRLIFAHATALLIAMFVAGIAMTDRGPFAGAGYIIPQLFWLCADIVLRWVKRPTMKSA